MASIVNGIKSFLSWFNPLSDDFILKKLWDFLTEIISYINPFSEKFILKDLWTFLTNIISYINPFSDNFLGRKIVELIGELLKSLFVPSEERITGLQNTVMSKFDFVESIKVAINSFKDIINNLGNAPVLTLNLSATKYTNAMTINVIDLNWYKPYKQYGDIVITAIIYAFYLIRLFMSLPSIISGVGGGLNETNIAMSDIEAYNKFGFGRRSSLTRRQK